MLVQPLLERVKFDFVPFQTFSKVVCGRNWDKVYVRPKMNRARRNRYRVDSVVNLKISNVANAVELNKPAIYRG